MYIKDLEVCPSGFLAEALALSSMICKSYTFREQQALQLRERDLCMMPVGYSETFAALSFRQPISERASIMEEPCTFLERKVEFYHHASLLTRLAQLIE